MAKIVHSTENSLVLTFLMFLCYGSEEVQSLL